LLVYLLYDVILPVATHFDHPRALALFMPPGDRAYALMQIFRGWVIPVPSITSTGSKKLRSQEFSEPLQDVQEGEADFSTTTKPG
jgi:hypothetical protein